MCVDEVERRLPVEPFGSMPDPQLIRARLESVQRRAEPDNEPGTLNLDAVQNAITKAAKTMRNMHWFQVMDTRGHIAEGKVAHWQVTLKIGFRLDDQA